MDKKCNKNHFPWEMNINDLPNIDSNTLRELDHFQNVFIVEIVPDKMLVSLVFFNLI